MDEVGRGPLAGDVVAAVVVAWPGWTLPGLDDSKKLTPARRQDLASRIRTCGVSWALGRASPAEIDRLNILQATFLAMRRALASLPQSPGSLVVDGNRPIPGLHLPQATVVGGDAKVAVIAAASILAKTQRDGEMVQMDSLYPGYGFALHMGYPVPMHLEALRRLGPCPIHRRSFAPVRESLSLLEPLELALGPVDHTPPCPAAPWAPHRDGFGAQDG